MIHVGIIGILLFTMAVFWKANYPKWSFYLAFTLKALATIVTGIYYLQYEKSGDLIHYFTEAIRFNEAYTSSIQQYIQALFTADISAADDNWHSVFFIKFIAPFALFTQGDFWITSLYMTLIAFGLTWRATVLISQAYQRKWLVYIAFFIVPSTLVWSGGLFKESISNGCFFLLVTYMVHLSSRTGSSGFHPKDWLQTGILILCWLILIKIRFYLAGLSLIFIVLGSWLRWFNGSTWIRWSTLLMFLLFGFFSMQLFHPYLRPDRLPLTFYENYLQIQAATDPEQAINYPNLAPNYSGLIITIPQASITGIFRPMIFETWDWEYLPFQIEKLSFLLLFLISLRSIPTIRLKSMEMIGIFILILLATSLAIASPNFGSLIRYQSVYTPFLFILVGFLPLQSLDYPSNK